MRGEVTGIPGHDGYEVRLECLNGTLSHIASMHLWWEKLVLDVPILIHRAPEIFASLIIEDL